MLLYGPVLRRTSRDFGPDFSEYSGCWPRRHHGIYRLCHTLPSTSTKIRAERPPREILGCQFHQGQCVIQLQAKGQRARNERRGRSERQLACSLFTHRRCTPAARPARTEDATDVLFFWTITLYGGLTLVYSTLLGPSSSSIYSSISSPSPSVAVCQSAVRFVTTLIHTSPPHLRAQRITRVGVFRSFHTTTVTAPCFASTLLRLNVSTARSSRSRRLCCDLYPILHESSRSSCHDKSTPEPDRVW
jgi:hypothetical protein